MKELLLRFAVGGLVVSSFAQLADLIEPQSFAGLFGAAPSVALATLALTSSSRGTSVAAVEARSMIAGAVAFFVYAYAVCWLLIRRRLPVMATTSVLIGLWFACAFGLWAIFLR